MFTVYTLILLGRYVLDAYLNTTHNIYTINKKNVTSCLKMALL